MKTATTQTGFSLITAIFLLVVLAGLGAAMVTFFTAQQHSSAMDVMGTRAYHAAQTGIEWGTFQALRNTSCAASQTLPPLASGLSPFTVIVTCAQNTYTEKGVSTVVYTIVSTASYGAEFSQDFVERRIQATVVR